METFPSTVTIKRALQKASKAFIFSRKPLKKSGKIDFRVLLAFFLRAGFMVYLIVMPSIGVRYLMSIDWTNSTFLDWFFNIIESLQSIAIIISLHAKDRKYEILLNKLNEIDANVRNVDGTLSVLSLAIPIRDNSREYIYKKNKINTNKHCDQTPNENKIYMIYVMIWFLTLSLLFSTSIAMNIQNQATVIGHLYGLWWCATTSMVHFYMVNVSVMTYSISETMAKLNSTIQKVLPEKIDQNKILEENHNELLYRTLKHTEEAYDDLCDCCSTLNEIFGFSVLIIILATFLYNLAVVYVTSHYLKHVGIYSGLVNLLQLWVSFYALTMAAASCESVHSSTSDLRRSLALFNSELLEGDRSLDVRKLARDVLHAVRARQPRLSACGLFDIRMSLVTGFLSLTATYSIVLLQFTHFL